MSTNDQPQNKVLGTIHEGTAWQAVLVEGLDGKEWRLYRDGAYETFFDLAEAETAFGRHCLEQMRHQMVMDELFADGKWPDPNRPRRVRPSRRSPP